MLTKNWAGTELNGVVDVVELKSSIWRATAYQAEDVTPDKSNVIVHVNGSNVANGIGVHMP